MIIFVNSQPRPERKIHQTRNGEIVEENISNGNTWSTDSLHLLTPTTFMVSKKPLYSSDAGMTAGFGGMFIGTVAILAGYFWQTQDKAAAPYVIGGLAAMSFGIITLIVSMAKKFRVSGSRRIFRRKFKDFTGQEISNDAARGFSLWQSDYTVTEDKRMWTIHNGLLHEAKAVPASFLESREVVSTSDSGDW